MVASMFDSLRGRGRSHGRKLTNYRGAWLAEHEGKNQPGFVSAGETRSSSFLSPWVTLRSARDAGAREKR